MANAVRVLVAPLDWGLGHATRSIPVIKRLLAGGADVHLGGSGKGLQLLRESFPALPWHSLPSYAFTYSKTGNQAWALARQLPRLRRVIRDEQTWLAKKMEGREFDAVFSDNRYGLTHPDIPTVIFCHQIYPIPPPGFRWARKPVGRLHRRFLSKFDRCWIPDLNGPGNLAADLSQGMETFAKFEYVGLASRFFDQIPTQIPQTPPASPAVPVLVILSGPEPHRELLEAEIRAQAPSFSEPVTIIRGIPGPPATETAGNVTMINHLPADDLANLIRRAGIVVSRPGYSSLMDYAALETRNLVLIPTPGQSEQIYLAKNLAKRGMALVVDQDHFSLQAVVHRAADYWGLATHPHNRSLDLAVDAWLRRLRETNPA